MWSPIVIVKTGSYEGPQVTYEEYPTYEEAEQFGISKYGDKFFGVENLGHELNPTYDYFTTIELH